MDFRGRDGQQVLKPGSDRPGDRPAAIAVPVEGPAATVLVQDARPGGDERPGGDRPGRTRVPAVTSVPAVAIARRPRPQGPQKGGGFDNVNRGGGGHDRRTADMPVSVIAAVEADMSAAVEAAVGRRTAVEVVVVGGGGGGTVVVADEAAVAVRCR